MIDISLRPGKYVVAVSGGVDSVALLHLLAQMQETRNQKPETSENTKRSMSNYYFLVAHFDHGIRNDSAKDRQHVQALARQYGLPFVYDVGRLGSGTSEARARAARYRFLYKVRLASDADAIVTAHHQDDVLETVVINLLRGTGRKGLSSLTSGKTIVRPLLQFPKSDIVDYANHHSLTWHEDSTNASDAYLRNRIRHHILPAWPAQERQKLVNITTHMQHINAQIDDLLGSELQPRLNREWFRVLPHDVATEVMAAWLRKQGLREFDKQTIERLTVAAKVAKSGKTIDAVKGRSVRIGEQDLALTPGER